MTMKGEAMIEPIEKGTIRSMEIKTVVSNFLDQHNVPRSCWGFKSSSLFLLVGSREATLPVKRGMTFYQVQQLLEKLERLVEERNRARDHRQTDLEDFTRGAMA